MRSSTRARTSSLAPLVALLAACSAEAPSEVARSLSVAAPGSAAVPAGPQSVATAPFLADPHAAGTAATLHLVEARFGRLVEVFDLDAVSGARRLVHSDFVVGAGIASDGVDYALAETLAGQTELTILHRVGTPAFHAALLAAEAATQPLADASLPPFSTLPRDAALSLRFDDLLDAGSVDATTVRLRVGTPAATPFQARLLVDRNHGGLADPDGDGHYDFYSTRVVADLTVSELEAQLAGTPLTVDPRGLPASGAGNAANVELRLPTQVFAPVGQTHVLTNAAGNALDPLANGSVDLGASTQDVLREWRAGAAGDAFRGYLPDTTSPRLVAELGAAIVGAVTPDADETGGWHVAALSFDVAACAQVPQPGDLLRQGASWAVVTEGGALVAQQLVGLRVRAVAGGAPSGGAAVLWSAYQPGTSVAACVPRYTPAPAVPPNRGVAPQAHVRVRFSEAMDADTVEPFQHLVLSRVAGVPTAADVVVSALVADADLAGFELAPAVALAHQAGANESYFVRLGLDETVRDLAGNPLTGAVGTSFQLLPSAPSVQSGSLALRFDSTDMLGGDGLPEVRGQVQFDLLAEELHPRPVVHFSRDADRSQPLQAVMAPLTTGIQAPLTPLGYKLQSLWRYADLGMSLEDETTMNVDVEGLAWAPIGGGVVADVYPEFSIQLGHASALPDEVPDPQSLFPKYPNSGLGTTYASNWAEAPALVHQRQLGYVLSPADVYLAASGAPRMPWPLNRGAAPGGDQFYTWRDTAVEALGGANGSGAPFDMEILVNGLSSTKTYAAGAVRSAGLPLLMEFRCYPTPNALGLNAVDVSLAINSSARPAFRAYSAGGFSAAGQPVTKDPDVEAVASGGFQPGTGAATLPSDNVTYMGSVDFVTRTSRACTVWFDTAAANPVFGSAALQASLPPGTHVELAFRGATAILGGAPGSAGDVRSDAQALDLYGDPNATSQGTPVFLNGDAGWKSDLTSLAGARYVQVRVSFTGDADTGATAALSALGLAWTD